MTRDWTRYSRRDLLRLAGGGLLALSAGGTGALLSPRSAYAALPITLDPTVDPLL
jgi:hypothetical protein